MRGWCGPVQGSIADDAGFQNPLGGSLYMRPDLPSAEGRYYTSSFGAAYLWTMRSNI
jgi:hypothetical protein